MDKETMQLVVVFILIMAFVGLVLFILGSIGIGGAGSVGMRIAKALWEGVAKFIDMVI